jgi:hypothetical protein
MPDNVILVYSGGIRLFDLGVARAPLLPAAHSRLDSNSAGKDHSQHARRPAMILAAQHACRIGVNRYRNELLLPCPRCPRQRPNSRQEARAPHMLRCEGPHRLTQKRPPTLVSVLRSLAAAALTFDFREIFRAWRVLLPFDEGRRHYSHLVAQRLRFAGPIVRRGTGLNVNRAGWQLLKERQDLATL